MVDKDPNKSDDKLALGKQLQEIRREKRIMKAILAYYDKLGPFNPKLGISLLEFKTYLVEQGYDDLRKAFLADIDSKIKNRESELTRTTRQTHLALTMLLIKHLMQCKVQSPDRSSRPTRPISS